MSKPRILSGIQPSGKLHIGNYLGALKNFVQLQEVGHFECYFFIADYHSLTEDYDPKEKARQTLDLALDFFALGLDPKKSTIFLQSQIPEHTELAWIFNTLASTGELERMTQYKDKAARQQKNINAGLFTYPVLQAADILLYRPQLVPVGNDQLQHLELTNTIARRFNHRFGQTFTTVKPLMTNTPRVMSLSNPNKKMSKSESTGCLFINDEPKEIEKKIKRAVTDTSPVGKEKSPGVANLFVLLQNFGTSKDVEKFEAAYSAGNIKYAELKAVLSQRIADYFSDFRKRRKKLAQNPEGIKKRIFAGSKKAKKIASATLADVKGKIGLLT